MAFIAINFLVSAGERKSRFLMIEPGGGFAPGELPVAPAMIDVAFDAAVVLRRRVKRLRGGDQRGDRGVALQTFFVGDAFEDEMAGVAITFDFLVLSRDRPGRERGFPGLGGRASGFQS